MKTKIKDNLKNGENSTIYHYCNFNNFKLIIENKTLRFSDITESNDSAELKWCNDLIKKYFEELKADIPKRKNKEAWEYLNDLVDSFYQKNFIERSYRVYALCFSNKRDLLSQWRGYADDARGLCIGFNKATLEKLVNRFKIINGLALCSDVTYDRQEQEKTIKEIIKWAQTNINSVLSEVNVNFDEIKTILAICTSKLFEKIVFFKNSFFEEEAEWRVCFIKLDDKNLNKSKNNIKNGYYLRDNKLIPYLEVNFSDENDLIKEVILGPKNNTNNINDFLKMNGIDISATESGGTYR